MWPPNLRRVKQKIAFSRDFKSRSYRRKLRRSPPILDANQVARRFLRLSIQGKLLYRPQFRLRYIRNQRNPQLLEQIF
tara:strand:+ start:105 stop:338 length:234 start_codon:yes stop_codon:yes gene_type:complete